MTVLDLRKEAIITEGRQLLRNMFHHVGIRRRNKTAQLRYTEADHSGTSAHVWRNIGIYFNFKVILDVSIM
jgi:hypothetical protein